MFREALRQPTKLSTPERGKHLRSEQRTYGEKNNEGHLPSTSAQRRFVSRFLIPEESIHPLIRFVVQFRTCKEVDMKGSGQTCAVAITRSMTGALTWSGSPLTVFDSRRILRTLQNEGSNGVRIVPEVSGLRLGVAELSKEGR